MGAIARRTIHAVASLGIACALIVGLSSCGAPAPSVASPSGAASPPVPTPSPTPSSSPFPSPTASEVAAYALGTEAVTPRGSRMTVFSIGSGERYRRPFKDYPWLAADIEFCLRSSVQNVIAIQDIRSEFAVEFEDGRRWPADISAPKGAETFSAVGRTIAPDECVRAPVVFGVPPDATVAYVVLWSPLGVVRWRAN